MRIKIVQVCEKCGRPEENVAPVIDRGSWRWHGGSEISVGVELAITNSEGNLEEVSATLTITLEPGDYPIPPPGGYPA